jgi:tripartite-type tricarboxylate transporter receptor subunit TctC
MLFATVANAINESLYTTLPFVFERDLAPVSLLTKLPNVVDVNRDLPITSIAGLIEYARAHPGKLNFGSGGTGTSIHLSGELFKTLAHVDMVHVPYRGAAVALADVMAGQIQLLFDNLPGSIEQIRSGRVRALAVTSAMRSPAMPDLPTVAEAGVPGYEATAWFGVALPARTPPAVIARLNRAVIDVLGQPAVVQRLAALGAASVPGTPDDMAAFVHGEIAKWAKVIAEAHVTPP